MNLATFHCSFGPYLLRHERSRHTPLHWVRSHPAALFEEFDLDSAEDICTITITKEGTPTPLLLVAVPTMSEVGTSTICAALVAETDRAFIGVHQRLLAYDLSQPVRLWEDATDHACPTAGGNGEASSLWQASWNWQLGICRAASSGQLTLNHPGSMK